MNHLVEALLLTAAGLYGLVRAVRGSSFRAMYGHDRDWYLRRARLFRPSYALVKTLTSIPLVAVRVACAAIGMVLLVVGVVKLS
jgi:hypothetical protein